MYTYNLCRKSNFELHIQRVYIFSGLDILVWLFVCLSVNQSVMPCSHGGAIKRCRTQSTHNWQYMISLRIVDQNSSSSSLNLWLRVDFGPVSLCLNKFLIAYMTYFSYKLWCQTSCQELIQKCWNRPLTFCSFCIPVFSPHIRSTTKRFRNPFCKLSTCFMSLPRCKCLIASS